MEEKPLNDQEKLLLRRIYLDGIRRDKLQDELDMSSRFLRILERDGLKKIIKYYYKNVLKESI